MFRIYARVGLSPHAAPKGPGKRLGQPAVRSASLLSLLAAGSLLLTAGSGFAAASGTASAQSAPSAPPSWQAGARMLLKSVPTLGVLRASMIAGDRPAGGGPPWPSHTLSVTLILRRAGPLPQPVAKGIELPPRLAVASVAPPPLAYDRVARYLKESGLTITRWDSGHLILEASGSVGSLERTFHTRIDAFTSHARPSASGASSLVFGPRASAQMPSSLAPYIAGVFGLSSFSLPVPSPLAALPSLTASASPPAPDKAGPALQANKAPLADAVPLATFTLSLTRPQYNPVAGLETDVTVSLRNAAGAPLPGYTIEPVVPSGVSVFQGPTGPSAMVTNQAGHASFWVLSGVPQSIGITALALPPAPPQTSTTPSKDAAPAGSSPPPEAPATGAPASPIYVSGQSLPVVFSGSTVSLKPYTADQINGAYGIAPLLAQGANGHGVGIGIVIWNRFSLSDVRQYMASQGIPMPHVRIVTVNGPLQTGSGGTEATLDVERAGATAPGASITVYDAGNTAGVLTALVDAIEAGRDQILSLSWGIPEADLPDNALNPLEVLFDAAAQEGMTVAVASGDTGSYGNGTAVGVGWPESSPMVLSVGGTEMAVGLGTDSIAQEAAWSPDGTFALGGGVSAPAASGGGYSRYYPRPVWQVGPGLPPIWQIPFRGTPDVSLAATYPGYVTVLDGKAQAYGGTSAAAPTWAGIIADIESGLGMDLGPEVMPLLYAFAAGLAPSPVFRTITEGTNGAYFVHSGWNPVTGLGTPNAEALYQAFQVTYTPRTIEAILPTPQMLTVEHPVTLAVAVLDRQGVPIGGVPVAAIAPKGGLVRPGNTQTGANGVATFTVSADRMGVRTFTFVVPAHHGPAGSGSRLVTQWTGHFGAAASPPAGIGKGKSKTSITLGPSHSLTSHHRNKGNAASPANSLTSQTGSGEGVSAKR